MKTGFFDEENIYNPYQILVFKNICYNQFVASDIMLIVVAARGAAIVLEEQRILYVSIKSVSK